MKSTVKVGDLIAFVEQAYRSAGAPQEYARTAAEVMVEANLCGVDSHGGWMRKAKPQMTPPKFSRADGWFPRGSTRDPGWP
ncbi:MAG: hypothetical protein QME78_10830 [Thermodesulfobacteriota bacterium]|nr:hypothetical protein [Thermodesulfobacteriota bacterium]